MTAPAPVRPKDLCISPVDILRRLRAVLADDSMTPAARIAAAAVVLCANGRTGLAWPGYRWIAKTFHVSHDAVRAALAEPKGRAIGKHLRRAGRGPCGVQIYGVIPLASAPKDSALPDTQRTESGGPAHCPSPASAPVSGLQRTAHRRETGVERAYEGAEGNSPPAPAARARAGKATASGNNGAAGKTPDLETLAQRVWESGPKPRGQTGQECLETLRRHVAERQYTVENLADYVQADGNGDPGPFWQLNEAVPRFLKRREDESRERRAILFQAVNKDDLAERRDGTARGTVIVRINDKIAVKIDGPDGIGPDGERFVNIKDVATFEKWAFRPPHAAVTSSKANAGAADTVA